MATKKLFSNKSASKSVSKKVTKVTNTVNNAGGTAYSMSDKATLAQLAMTGCFNGTYYVSGEDQLKKTLELANKLPAEFVAKLAVYARQKGLMKDMPAVLAAVVAGKDSDLLSKIFPQVVDSPKMLRNFVQVVRSGATGRKSLGTRPKKLIQKYLDSMTDEQLFKADVGNDPSLQDIIKLVHPKPSNKQRSALFGYLLDKEYNKKDLCKLAKQFESFKKDMSGEIPDVPFQMLTALPLTSAHWKQIAENATWTQVRMNLNTFERHGVFADSGLTNALCEKLQDAELIKKAKVFPYQLFTAYQNVDSKVPVKVQVALQKAADLALHNIPELEGQAFVLVDTSGSMKSPVTGHRGSVTSKTTCVDVAALVASALLRKNPDTEIVPFDTQVHEHRLNPMDSIVTNARSLARFGGGGTNCSEALAHLNRKNAKGNLVIYVSDNESWVDSGKASQGPAGSGFYGTGYHYAQPRGTATMVEWNKFKARNPSAKLVCIDITPNGTTQAHDRDDILNIGGFSDNCFEVIKAFIEMGNNRDLWVKTIEAVDIS
jgi:60 kDa SS-A/Ro ribonucleoprotein